MSEDSKRLISRRDLLLAGTVGISWLGLGFGVFRGGANDEPAGTSSERPSDREDNQNRSVDEGERLDRVERESEPRPGESASE